MVHTYRCDVMRRHLRHRVLGLPDRHQWLRARHPSPCHRARSVAALAARWTRLPRCIPRIARTAAQLAIAFWDYLGDRVRISGQPRPVHRRDPPAWMQAPQVLPLLRNASISPTKGWKNLENEADIQGKGTHGLRDLRRLGGGVGSDRARGPLVRNGKQTA
jgi:hypothetical protein